MRDATGCSYINGYDRCDADPEENNYAEFVNLESTREAIHVGDVSFGAQSDDVYNSLIDDFMRSQRETVEFLLELYPVSNS